MHIKVAKDKDGEIEYDRKGDTLLELSIKASDEQVQEDLQHKYER